MEAAFPQAGLCRFFQDLSPAIVKMNACLGMDLVRLAALLHIFGIS